MIGILTNNLNDFHKYKHKIVIPETQPFDLWTVK